MNDAVVPPVRSRVPTTAGPWQLVGRFDSTGGDIEPGPIVGPADVDGAVSSWLQRFDERMTGLVTPSQDPHAVPQLSLGGRPILPSAPTAAVLRAAPPGVRAQQPFILMAAEGADRVPGASVGEGAFEINEVTIPVSGFDSLDEVLDRIERSGTGVSARFDGLTGEVVLRSISRGSTARITLGRDTSRFLAEFGLERATPEPGLDAGYDGPLGGLGGLGAVIAGLVVVNGDPVRIDPGVDALAPALDRITRSTDAIAVFDRSSRRVVLVVASPPGALEIDDATGLFDALGFAPGAYTSTLSTRGVSVREPTLVIRSWSATSDRVLRREPEPGDRYHLAATRSLGERGTTDRPAPGHGTITDRIASTPRRISTDRFGTAAEEIAIRRQFLV